LFGVATFSVQATPDFRLHPHLGAKKPLGRRQGKCVPNISQMQVTHHHYITSKKPSYNSKILFFQKRKRPIPDNVRIYSQKQSHSIYSYGGFFNGFWNTNLLMKSCKPKWINYNFKWITLNFKWIKFNFKWF